MIGLGHMNLDEFLLEVATQSIDEGGFVLGVVLAFVYEDPESGSMVMVKRTSGMRSTELLGLGEIIKEYAKDELFQTEELG